MVVYLHESLDERLASVVPLKHEDIEAAAIGGVVQRLRPKLMTVTAVLASLIPILWESGIGSDMRKPIAAPIWAAWSPHNPRINPGPCVLCSHEGACALRALDFQDRQDDPKIRCFTSVFEFRPTCQHLPCSNFSISVLKSNESIGLSSGPGERRAGERRGCFGPSFMSFSF